MQMTAPSMSTPSEWRKPRSALDGKDLLTHLFNRLDGAYPGQFARQFRTLQAIENWRDAWEEAFLQEGIQPAELAQALARLPAKYPPGLPDFLALCRPPIDPEAAFYEASAGAHARKRGEMGVWTHPAIYWAMISVGQHDVMHASWTVMRARWEGALRTTLLRGEWPPVPAPVKALPPPGSEVVTQEEGARKIAALASDAISRPRRSPKAWAQRILDNPRRYTPAMLAMARRALNQPILEG